jgi:glycosyltransferase involved in cell wall biosynthesis
VILGLLKAQNRDNFEVSVTLVGSEPDLNRDFAHEIRQLGVRVKNFLFNGRLDWTGVRRLRNYISEQNLHLIHCHDFKANFYGLMATLGTGVKRVTTVHGSTRDSLLLKLYLDLSEYLLIRFFHKVIAVSEPLTKELRAKLLRLKRVAFIPNGIDLAFFDKSGDGRIQEPDLSIPPGSTVIGTVGRLFPDKGHKDLFKALRFLKDEFPDLILLVVGDGPQAEYLRLCRDEMGLQDKVFFVGVRFDMRKVYDLLDIFVMPSIREGLPMALLEAMLAEIPVVATNVGGMKALLEDGKRGRTVNPLDPENLGSEIRALLLHPEQASQMAQEASAFVRAEYSSETMARRTETLYRGVMAET